MATLRRENMDLNTGLEVQALPIEDTWKDIVRIDNDPEKINKGNIYIEAPSAELALEINRDE
jgi:hypothetical protein